jgi:phenylacetate-CoA ligase
MSDYKYFTIPRSSDKQISELRSKDPSFWEKMSEKKIVGFANYVIENVPAYKRLLKDKGIKLRKLRSIEDFKKLPLISKAEYLKKYGYTDLFPRGGISRITTISSTSGSTGEPFYFPRGEEQDQQYEYVAELFLRNQFSLDGKKTLAINGFGLGIWIGGIFTYKNFNKIAGKGYRLAVAPTGTNKEIFLKTFKKTAHLFEQVILMGYPPFIKDVVDEAKKYSINWGGYNIKVLTATEGYTERFREYLIKKLGIKDRYTDIINIYGSVELGTMSHETPIANLIRKIADDKPKVFKKIFPNATEIPTLAQYYPYIVYFEEVDGEVVASGFGSSFPLLRYKFSDSGGVLSYNTMVKNLREVGVDIIKEAKNSKIEKTIFKLPFVYVYSRSDFVIILRGANIYPENIKDALQDPSVEKFVTGKFCMVKREDKKLEEYLEVNVELKKEISKSLKVRKKIEKVVLKTLRAKNSEYDYLYTTEGKKLSPKIILYPYEYPKYFKLEIKQSWVKK